MAANALKTDAVQSEGDAASGVDQVGWAGALGAKLAIGTG
jgi:hypothetical protein